MPPNLETAMMCYKDMTFCNEAKCAKFGDEKDDCESSFTKKVEYQANQWWNNAKEWDESWADAPVAMFTHTPDCFEAKK